MKKGVAISNLNARTIDILNTIRENASAAYQERIPVVEGNDDIVAVGRALEGYPARANEFVSALVNRIAFVRMRSMTFNNPLKILKKGIIELGDSVEDIFIGIATATTYDPYRADVREHKITPPDIKSEFHIINYSVQYPVSVVRGRLRKAFLTVEGVTDLINEIINTVYKAAEYDEFLLFKYLIIKGVTSGDFYPIGVDPVNPSDAAVAFRSMSNILMFPKEEYNRKQVLNNTPRERQVMIMGAAFNGQFDVEVLASAFNMDKADYIGRQILVDDFTSFDNKRFDQLRRQGLKGFDPVTPEELAMMSQVKAILVDEDYFQMYDSMFELTETQLGSAVAWNYWLTVEKIVSTSGFANAVVFVDNGGITPEPATINGKVVDKITSADSTILVVQLDPPAGIVNLGGLLFVQDDNSAMAGIAVKEYGAFIWGKDNTKAVNIKASTGTVDYMSQGPLSPTAQVGDAVIMEKVQPQRMLKKK